jgi:hypothetical protein
VFECQDNTRVQQGVTFAYNSTYDGDYLTKVRETLKPYDVYAESVTLTLPSSASYYIAAPITTAITITNQIEFERALAIVTSNIDIRNSVRGLEVRINKKPSVSEKKEDSGGGDSGY